MPTSVIMPQMGESVVEGTVGRWLKQEGDPVREYEPLLEVETDKVTSEVTASASGTLLKIYVSEGQTVPAGTVLAVIGQPGEEIPAQAPPAETHHAPPSESVPEPVTGQAPQAIAAQQAGAAPPRAGGDSSSGNRAGMPHVTPVVARMAAEHNIDLSRVRGTGRGGRVTKKDVLAYLERGAPQTAEVELPPWEQPGTGDLFKPTDDLYQKPAAAPAAEQARPAPADHVHKAPPAPGKPGELIPLSTMRRRIAEHMVRSKLQTAPHVTTVFEANQR